MDAYWQHRGGHSDFASFRKAFLADVDFSGARLTRAVFDGALLRGARFEQANLADAALDGAILDAAVSADAAWMEHIERLIRGAWQVTAEPNRGMSDRYSDDETLLVIRPNL